MESAACNGDHTEIKVHSFPYVSVLTLTVTFPILKLLFLVLVGKHGNKIYLVTAVYSLSLTLDKFALNL